MSLPQHGQIICVLKKQMRCQATKIYSLEAERAHAHANAGTQLNAVTTGSSEVEGEGVDVGLDAKQRHRVGVNCLM